MATTQDDRARARGFYFRVRASLASSEALDAIQAAIGPEAFGAFEWQIASSDRGSTAIAMPKEMPTLRQMSVHRAELSRRSEGLRSGPVHEITNGPEEEPPDVTEVVWAAAPPEPPFDWFWPLNERLPLDAYAGAPTIRIAHLDTGLSAHPSLTGRYDAASGINPVDYPDSPNGRAVICWGRPWVWDLIDHGTGTAAMILGEHRDEAEPMNGLAGIVPPGVAIVVPARVLNDGPLIGPWDVQRVAATIDWAVAVAGCNVISISLGYPLPDLAPVDAIERACQAGVIVCAAAGQMYPSMVWPATSALAGWSVCCGGSTVQRTPYEDSAWLEFSGGYVTIAAPARSITKASWVHRDCSSNKPMYWRSAGTSYAAPYVAGVAALWRARNYAAVGVLPKDAVVPTFRRVLAATATPWSDELIREDPRFGPGIINPRAVIETAP